MSQFKRPPRVAGYTASSSLSPWSHSISSSEDTSVNRWSHSQLTSSCRAKERQKKRRIREAERDIPRKWVRGIERGGGGAEGVNVHIINLDYLRDRQQPPLVLKKQLDRPFVGSSQAIFTKNSLTSLTSCSGAKTLVSSFKSISPSWGNSAVKFT